MSRRFLVLPLLGILILSGSFLLAEPGRKTDQDLNLQMKEQLIQTLVQYYGAYSAQGEAAYVGSGACLACHPSYDSWEDTVHASFLRRPLAEYSLIPRKGVIADYDDNGVDDFIQGLDFNEIDSVFNTYKPNAPILSYENGTYWVQVGELLCPLTFTQAGQSETNGQRYVVRVPVADTATGYTESNYFAPLAYTPGVGWTAYSPQNWYGSDNLPRWSSATTSADLSGHGGNYSRTCVGCHTPGIKQVGANAKGEVVFKGYPAVLFSANDPTVFDYDGDGQFDAMNIGCEACHGPGALHIINHGSPSYIVNPSKLEAQAKTDICGRCHTRPKSVPNGTWEWPYNDATGTNWTPVLAKDGVPLTDFMTDNSTLWPDGKHRRATRPYHDFMESSKPTFPFHMVYCSECHSPHEEAQKYMIRDVIVDGELEIHTEVENNTLCLACHATHGAFEEITKEDVANIEEEEAQDLIAKVVSAHTNHPYGPERSMGLSRCVGCHMPVTGGFGSQLSLPSHTFEAIGPFKTLDYQAEGGMPNACAQTCHAYKVNSFDLGLDPNPVNSVWNEQFDRDLAEELVKYYGPGGMWWDTEHE